MPNLCCYGDIAHITRYCHKLQILGDRRQKGINKWRPEEDSKIKHHIPTQTEGHLSKTQRHEENEKTKEHRSRHSKSLTIQDDENRHDKKRETDWEDKINTRDKNSKGNSKVVKKAT